MRYFATVGGSHTETQIEKKVLASNPIMEAIGNAKTIRNDNSSRFGKYIQIDFNKNWHIVGAHMRTYLLEKSRVVFQATEERNYHIFYQLCSVCEEPEYEQLKLNHQDDFVYTSQGECPTVDSIDDVKQLQDLRESLTLLGIHEENQMMIFRILAAILHMGNVKIVDGENDTSLVKRGNPKIGIVSDLLGVDVELLRGWLCSRKIVTHGETYIKGLKKTDAMFARDALAKHIYAKLFDWIVLQINRELKCTAKKLRFTGVLDIYGFETFEINSFEQFCINYANEKLQQQFNMHVFKLEQEEYVKEKIQWSFIDFYDNQPCIDLIEAKMGILDLLDEECRMPKGSDKSWCDKMYKNMEGKSKQFAKPRLSNTAFIVLHFADNVQYEVLGFLEKNRDTVIEEHLAVLRTSKYDLVKELFTEAVVKPSKSKAPAKPSSQKSRKSTVGSQFRDSLKALMEVMNTTTPHYVRCIKPNDEKESFQFDPKRAIQQLRACGVLETIRISAAGYPSRWTYQEFLNRYRVLIRSKDINRKDMRLTCENLLQNLIKDPDKFQFGKTKIFFRAGQVAYMEKLRSDRLRACGIMIQKHVRGFLHRTRYQRLRSATVTVQRIVRGFVARRRLRFLKRTKAAITMQRYIRGFVQSQKHGRLRRLAIGLQAHIRGIHARGRYVVLLRNHKAVILQRNVRMWLTKKRYQKVRCGLIRLQCHVRRRAAQAQFKALKIEARSIAHVKKMNLGLENKIISLQQKVDEVNKENGRLRVGVESVAALRAQVDVLKASEQESKLALNKITELEEAVRAISKELENEREEKKDLGSEKDAAEKGYLEEFARLQAENAELREELKALTNLGQSDKHEERQRTDDEMQMAQAELDEERSAHQNLLRRHAELEHRFELIQLQQRAPPRRHVRSSSDISTASIETEASEASTVRMDDVQSIRNEDGSIGDQGYGTATRRVKPDRKSAEDEDDMSNEEVHLKLMAQVKDLAAERERLQDQVDTLTARMSGKENGPDIRVTAGSPDDQRKQEVDMTAAESLKINDLEIENSKLKENIRKLRESVADTSGSDSDKVMIDQFAAMEAELERRRDEVIQLKSILAMRQQGMSAVLREQYGGADSDMLNEDGELEIAYRTMKDTNRLLESQLQNEKHNHSKMENEYKQEMQKLKKDNERQQKIIALHLKMTPGELQSNQIQHEMQRLTEENLNLNETLELQQDQIQKMKKQLKLYAKRLKAEGSETNLDEILQQDVQTGSPDANMPVVKHKEVEYMGMFEYRADDELHLMKSLIYDLRPQVASGLLPGLPAYIIFMCIRHTDYVNNDEKVRSLLTYTINGIKRLFKKKRDDLEYATLWLANTCRLLHNLKQYSGEKVNYSLLIVYITDRPRLSSGMLSTSNNGKVELRHHSFAISLHVDNIPEFSFPAVTFTLSKLRKLCSFCRGVFECWNCCKTTSVSALSEQRQQSQPSVNNDNSLSPQFASPILPGVLEHEAIKGMSVTTPGLRRQPSVSQSPVQSPSHVDAMEILMRQITYFYQVCQSHAIDPELINQIFKQLFYYITAGALNNLLLRKDLCHWSKGMQMRYNISHLECFIRDNNLQDAGALEALQPIIQASQLLQARKTEADVQSICEMCTKLTVQQIVKILHLYSPVNEFEERVPVSFIRKIQEHLKSRQDGDASQTLLMDTKFTYPVRFPFNPSQVQLEQIAAPDCLGLQFLKRL
ncbi:PREDICTED: unconventional myosin-Vb-like [Priapulus caudatus]|uniref:Unconventional myosin-Vb-like n=1 Tax=Priapulus caudatus TaxID=37621 RepID=A0ABM1E322_PRICU|nr:PREDICTED: unconventional myosin-Vb-like [Priapulus caudatus]